MQKRRLIAVLAVLMCAALTVPTALGASSPTPRVRTVKSPIEPGLTLGLSGATGQLAEGALASMGAWAAKAHAVGAQIVRLGVEWAAVAPTTPPAGFVASDPNSPGYDWTTTDQQVKQLTSEGFKVLIEVQDAPTWAEGSGMPSSATLGSWEPNAVAFGQFASALATRYDGSTADPSSPGTDLPRVSYWQAWNEPNLSTYLAPQWVSSGGTEVAESTTIYRNLENAFYAAVKAVSSSNFVVGAGTAPYGDPPGGQRMSPVTFDQHLLCLTSTNAAAGGCPGRTYMDAIDDHPYVSDLCCEGPTWHAALPADTSIADMYKIADVLKAAESAGTVAPAGATSVWASEIGWNTNPPNPNSSEASSAAQVGKWATQALYVLWSQGVSTVLWYQLADDPEASGGWADTYTEGLYYDGGAAKPAAASYYFPFLTTRQTKSRLQAWGRSPKSGILSIQRRNGRHWVTLERLTVRAESVFQVLLQLTGKMTLRAVISGAISPAWTQSS